MEGSDQSQWVRIMPAKGCLGKIQRVPRAKDELAKTKTRGSEIC